MLKYDRVVSGIIVMVVIIKCYKLIQGLGLR